MSSFYWKGQNVLAKMLSMLDDYRGRSDESRRLWVASASRWAPLRRGHVRAPHAVVTRCASRRSLFDTHLAALVARLRSEPQARGSPTTSYPHTLSTIRSTWRLWATASSSPSRTSSQSIQESRPTISCCPTATVSSSAQWWVKYIFKFVPLGAKYCIWSSVIWVRTFTYVLCSMFCHYTP